MAVYVMTADEDEGTIDWAVAPFLAGCSKLLPTLVTHEARLPRWDREDPGATANLVVWPLPCHPIALPLLLCTPILSRTTYPFVCLCLAVCLLACALPNGPFFFFSLCAECRLAKIN